MQKGGRAQQKPLEVFKVLTNLIIEPLLYCRPETAVDLDEG